MKPSSQSRLRVPVYVAAALICAITAPARASSLCAGDFLTSQVHPWPAGVSFNVPLRETSATSKARSQAFRAGLQTAGLVLDPQGQATLNVVFSISPGRDAKAGAARAGIYNDLEWRPKSAPGSAANDPSLAGNSLNLTVIVSDNRAYQQLWIGSLACTVKTADTEALARDIGLTLGKTLIGAIGQR